MRDETFERYYDVLQNIEYAILSAYERETTLLDLDVIDALDGLVRRYGAEEQSRTPPRLRLSPQASRIYAAAEQMCEWRLGRAPLNPGEDEAVIPPDQCNTVSDIAICLKRIRKSVHTWTEQGGRQGYLLYIAHFFEQMQGGGAPHSRKIRV
jgi:hypothetical protein